MEKANRAMCMARDNTAELNAVRQILPVRTIIDGEAIGNATEFGKVVRRSTCAAIVTFDGAACSLTFCGNIVGSGTSPIIASIPTGSGILALDGARSNARALLI